MHMTNPPKMAAAYQSTAEALLVLLLLWSLNAADASGSWPRRYDEEEEEAPVKGGYWSYEASSRLPASRLKSRLFTHILFAFAQVNATTSKLRISPEAKGPLQTFAADVRRNNPHVHPLLSISAGDPESGTFANSMTRGVFIASTIATARRYNLDGLDLDWEFPENASQMADLAALLAEWRRAVNAEAVATKRPPLLLTAAVYYASNFVVYGGKRAYPAESIASNLDWINVMNYDYHGSWDKSHTGALAALYDPNSNISTAYGIESWLVAGVPATKVAMGIPMYGTSWLLRDASQTYIGAPATAAKGEMMYSKIVKMLERPNATEVFDNTTVSAYAYNGDWWASYDNATSVAVKTRYARDKALRGYFFWSLEQDYLWTLATAASQAWDRP